MPITIQFANQVLKLRRQNVTPARMAESLGRSEAEIMDAHRMLGISIAGETVAQRAAPADEERAALRDRVPKKWQGHYQKGKQ